MSRPNGAASRASRLTSTTPAGWPNPDDDDPIGRLQRILAAAVTAPPAERIELYRDQLADGGPPVVDLLLTLERDRPRLGLFVVAVLEATARRRLAVAEQAIRLLITSGADPQTRAYAADAIGRLELPRAAAKRPSGQTAPATPLDRINLARRRRGEPILDAAEAQKVLDNLAARHSDPRRYRNICWSCHAVVDAATNERCVQCSWLVCWCGGCRAPSYVDPGTGQKGPCRQEVWLLADEMGDGSIELDTDFRGSPILTSQPPAADAPYIAAELRTRGIDAVYHWTPRRSIGSILRWGILSRGTLMERAIPFVGHGYGTLEKEGLLSAYVCISFAPKPWMMQEWSESPVLLELTPEALLGDGTLFIPGNSASGTFSASSLSSMNGMPAAQGLFLSGRVALQAEAWVRGWLPRIGIRAIHVADDVMARLVAADLRVDLRKDLLRPIHVSPSYFASPQAADLS